MVQFKKKKTRYFNIFFTKVNLIILFIEMIYFLVALFTDNLGFLISGNFTLFWSPFLIWYLKKMVILSDNGKETKLWFLKLLIFSLSKLFFYLVPILIVFGLSKIKEIEEIFDVTAPIISLIPLTLMIFLF